MRQPGDGVPKNFHGKKGKSGRKSAYEEIRNARDTQSMFFDNLSQDELELKIKSGVFSIRDRYLLTAMEGDTKILESLSKKVLPDKIDLKGDLSISDVLDQLDGSKTSQQAVEDESPLSDKE